MTAPNKPQPQQQTKEQSLTHIPMAGGMLKPTTLQEAIELATLIADSGMVPKNYEGKPGAVLIAIEMGAELGLPPMAAIQNIAVINGRPSLWGDAGLAIVRSHKDFIDIVEELDTSNPKNPTATCIITRKGNTPTERSFSWTDAERAGLKGKQGPWTNYPKRMLQMRARWFAMRDAFPDALRGINSAEESGDIVVERAEFVDDGGDLKPGKHSFAKPKRTARVDEPSFSAPPPPPPQPDEEPPHDPATGEVRGSESAAQATNPARDFVMEAAVFDPNASRFPVPGGDVGF